MNLSDKNKKILEEALNCTITIDSETDVHEVYSIYCNIKGLIDLMGYNKKEKYYYVSSYYIDKLSSRNEIVITDIGVLSFGFIFTNDLNNVDI